MNQGILLFTSRAFYRFVRTYCLQTFVVLVPVAVPISNPKLVWQQGSRSKNLEKKVRQMRPSANELRWQQAVTADKGELRSRAWKFRMQPIPIMPSFYVISEHDLATSTGIIFWSSHLPYLLKYRASVSRHLRVDSDTARGCCWQLRRVWQNLPLHFILVCQSSEK